MIYTFYSYKGGVGRSMALANVADTLARSGLRVLMIDFDLEAPGLEQFFEINHTRIRRHQGLLDLLLNYKHAMSVAADDDEEEQPFRRLQENFILQVYGELPSGGRLDLLPAGQRGDGEQLARYAFHLRTFDWQDFYFNWAGETFFEWLRKSLGELYDAVLVDSRTGVTEMGGICAYQLADVVVMFCASNHQNLNGTFNVAQNFSSPRVQSRRQDRPLQVVIVPARVEQRDNNLLQVFRQRFEEAFEQYIPDPLQRAKISFWDLLIPYDPQYAFEEKVITDPNRADERRQMVAAFSNLTKAMTLLAEPEKSETALESLPIQGESFSKGIEPQYDVTKQFAEYDAFLSYSYTSEAIVEDIALRLTDAGLRVSFNAWNPGPGEPWQGPMQETVANCRNFVLFIGSSGETPWINEEFRSVVSKYLSNRHKRLIPVLLPRAKPDPKLPFFFTESDWVDLRAGVEDTVAIERLVAGIRGEAPKSSKTVVDQGSPYKGLSPYAEEDARFFYGREALVQQIVERVRNNRFLAVIGPSGSGKSSLVFAGVLPRIRQNTGSDSENCLLVSLTPGPDPLETLASSLSALLPENSERDRLKWGRELRKQFAKNDNVLTGMSLREIVSDLVPGSPSIVLVVDQFEEVFTLCWDANERKQFIINLISASTDIEGQTKVIITMRSDFYGKCAAYPDLAAMLSDHQVLLGPMSMEELREVIEEPVRKVGGMFEPGLVDRLLDDVAEEPGALPFLQFMLYQLWEQRRDGRLTHSAYEESGGVKMALAQRADAVYAQLSEEERFVLRQIFFRLTQPGEKTSDTRRRVNKRELFITSIQPETVERVIRQLVDARLLTTTSDLTSGEEFVEISSEALIHSWSRFREWLEENRESLRFHRRLSEAANEWARCRRDQSYLYRGTRLAEAKKWEKNHADELSQLETEFLKTSISFQRRSFTIFPLIAGGLIGTIFGIIIASLSPDPIIGVWVGLAVFLIISGRLFIGETTKLVSEWLHKKFNTKG